MFVVVVARTCHRPISCRAALKIVLDLCWLNRIKTGYFNRLLDDDDTKYFFINKDCPASKIILTTRARKKVKFKLTQAYKDLYQRVTLPRSYVTRYLATFSRICHPKCEL